MKRRRLAEFDLDACPCCREPIKSWGQHVRRHPECAEAMQQDAEVDYSQDSLQLDAERRERQAILADAIAELTYIRNLNTPDVECAIAMARTAIHQHSVRAAQGLAHLLRPGVTADQVLDVLIDLERQSSVFEGLETEAQRDSILRQSHPFIAPRIVVCGPAKQKVVSCPVKDLLTRQLKYNPGLCRAVWLASEEYKKGCLHRRPADRFETLADGSALRDHAELLRTARPDEVLDLRVPLIFYGDEIEVRSPRRPALSPEHLIAGGVRSHSLARAHHRS